jgi:hypothetical protein
VLKRCAVLCLLASCEGTTPYAQQQETGTKQQALITHTFDFATQAPERMAIMFTMAWFGISSNPAIEPQNPPGKDADYRNWNAGGTPCAMATSDASKSAACIRMGVNNACVEMDATGALQRTISSRRRPLTGIWSGTGRDVESQRKIDLMLSMVRRPGCRSDDGARLDLWTMQNNSIKLSSKYVATNPDTSADFPYRTMMAMFARADAAGMRGVIMPGFDETFYFHFSSNVGLGACDDSAGNPRATCISALEDDLRDLVLEAQQHPSAFVVNGKVVLFIYTDSYVPNVPTPAEWRDTVLPAVRAAANSDFYVIGVNGDPTYFEAFDALAPWLAFSTYNNATGTTVYQDSLTHTVKRHQALIAGVGAYPGRLVFGGLTPGFDDWTRNWSGPCQERQLPPDSPRDPELMTAQSDFFYGCMNDGGCITQPSVVGHYDFRGFVGETWDDWTEGSHFEPDVSEGPDKLVRLRQLLGRAFGDVYPDTAGDTRLKNRWLSYGQARNGLGGDAGIPPVTDLSCDPDAGTSVDAGTSDAGSATDAGTHDAGTPDAGTAKPDAGSSPPDAGTGSSTPNPCHCSAAGSPFLLALLALARRRRRRPS